MAEPAYKRLNVDERRAQLLELGADLFAKHGYEGISMSGIAEAAGISKALLYHYFPSKSEYFRATLGKAAAEMIARTRPDPAAPPRPPLEQLGASIDAYLDWIESNSLAYTKLLDSAGVPEVKELVASIREPTAGLILDALFPDGPPARARTAVHAWLWFMDGACLDWLAHDDFPRSELRDLLLDALLGALTAAGAAPALAALGAAP